MTLSKARKAAEKAANAWEEKIRAAGLNPDGEMTQPLPPENSHTDFVSFVDNIWMPLQVLGNNRKPKTVSFYRSMTKNINAYFHGRGLQEITPMDIQKYLTYLRTEYISKSGQPLTHRRLRER